MVILRATLLDALVECVEIILNMTSGSCGVDGNSRTNTRRGSVPWIPDPPQLLSVSSAIRESVSSPARSRLVERGGRFEVHDRTVDGPGDSCAGVIRDEQSTPITASPSYLSAWRWRKRDAKREETP